MFIPESVVIGMGLFFGWILVTAVLGRLTAKDPGRSGVYNPLILIETVLFAAVVGYFIGQGTCG